MQTNEFERQVQTNMDELELNPSASVWEKVEEKLQKRKRRRVIVFYILPLAILLLGFSAYLIVNSESKNELTQQSSAGNEKTLAKDKDKQTVQPGENQSGNQNNIPTPQKDLTIDKADKNDVPVKDEITQKEKPVIADKQRAIAADKNNDLQITTVNPGVSPLKNKKETPKNNVPVIAQKKADPSPLTNITIKDDSKLDMTIDKPAIGNIVKNDKTKNIDQPGKVQTDKEDKADKVVAKDDVAVKDESSSKKDNTNKEDVAQIDNKEKPLVKKKQRNARLSFGVEFSGGATENNNTSFPLSSSSASRADYMYASPQNATTGNLPYALNVASPIRTGPAFRFGLNTELQVSERVRVSTGVRYSYASNKIKTGERVDTTVSINQVNGGLSTDLKVYAVYSGPQKEDYINRFHFIQLPVALHWQINKGKRMPAIQWDAGASIGFLLGSNALLYDPGYNGIYYHNTEALNKTHISTSTGVSVRLKNKRNSEWILGPEVSLDMSKVVKTGYDKIQYLLYGGITGKLLFHKKKK